MTLTLQHVNPAGLRAFMGTLTDNADVHASLAEAARALGVNAGTFELLGGLTRVEFTEYDFLTRQRKPALSFERALEIVAGHGTLSLLDGAPSVHLHLVCAFRDDAAPHGIAIVGGHAARAIAFAVEFTLLAFDGATVQRAQHAGTGLKLWSLPSLPTGAGMGLRAS
ncbi:MAG: DNA-binding protein [Anaerolineales bacterium]|nr:DNA-binding protein [Anaerolineales bacterium]